jgi:uncharacterized Zn-binding protein involved in type VI secretion
VTRAARDRDTCHTSIDRRRNRGGAGLAERLETGDNRYEAMGKPIAKMGDRLIGVDTHFLLMSTPGGPVVSPQPLPFDGPLNLMLAMAVFVDNRPVVVQGSMAINTPNHIPTVGPFVRQPHNTGTVVTASTTIFAGGKGVARQGDRGSLCNDPVDQETGVIVAAGTVFAD